MEIKMLSNNKDIDRSNLEISEQIKAHPDLYITHLEQKTIFLERENDYLRMQLGSSVAIGKHWQRKMKKIAKELREAHFVQNNT
jgi:hypothetical protein